MSIKKVLIIGAGVSGLSTAIFLKKAGIKSEVFETFPYTRVEESSFRINKSGVNILNELGVLDKIKKNSHSADSLRLLTTNNDELARFNLMQRSSAFSDRSIFMKRSDLIEILLDEAKQLGITINSHKKLIKLDQSENSVTAYFEDGSNAEGSIIVGADGLNSTVRKQIYSDSQVSYAKSWALYGVASLDDMKSEIATDLETGDEMIYVDQNFALFLAKSHPTSDLNLSWQVSSYNERKLPKQDHELKNEDIIKKDLITNFQITGPLKEIILKTKKIIPKQLHTVTNLPSFSKWRAVLIGDAAHGINPNTGYGSTIAMEDALYVAKMLKSYDFLDAFYFFEHDRKDRIQAIQQLVETFDLSKGFDLSGGFDIGLFSGSTFDQNYKLKWNDQE